MAVKRVVNTEFWTDEKVVETFSPEDKLFMLYLLTNPHTKQLGIYKLVKKQCAFELGYSIDTVSILLDRFENKYGILMYSNTTNEIAIKNFLVHSIVKGGKPVEDCLLKDISEIKDKRLIDYVFKNLSNKENLNETVVKIINDYKKNDNGNDKDKDNDNDNIVVVSYNDSLDSVKNVNVFNTVSPSSKYNCTNEGNNIGLSSTVGEENQTLLLDSGKKISTYTIDIIEHWNKLGEPKCTKITEELDKIVKKALKDYSEEEIKTAITNYKTVLHDKSYFFSYSWNIQKFLKQSNCLGDFTPQGEKWVNYCNQKGLSVDRNDTKKYETNENGVYSVE